MNIISEELYEKSITNKHDTVDNVTDQTMLRQMDINHGEVVVKNGDEGYLIPGVHYAPEVTLNIHSIEQLERQGIDIIYEDNTCRKPWGILECLFCKGIWQDRGNFRTVNTGEEVRRCYINFLDVFTSYYKTARVPKQEHNYVLSMPKKIVEKGKENTYLASHQCDFGDIQAPNMEATNRKGKKKIEHFGIVLEDTSRESDSHHFQPIQPNIKRNQTMKKDIQGMIKRPEPADKEDTNSSSSDDFMIII
nr:ARID DNA-binding domain-containing protein [Tanacetum cinerariifolium]